MNDLCCHGLEGDCRPDVGEYLGGDAGGDQRGAIRGTCDYMASSQAESWLKVKGLGVFR